ncbi:hypothetical protein PRIPAC_91328 [Pristionchus pacificus]|uniref:Uncharacterized protein n=1 Tax=Pristionchus pacificus TaxID=54126 RepID=A0A2A6CYC5_PRIPA|nr:hypothetical protein PRIPAC_91328 [Pristionchus pacificus]|eukprot:PDM83110.1 hypothetical protein PRIPAC_37503 [Pristionchus pacificus]
MLAFLLILFTSVEKVSPFCLEAINSTEHFVIIESCSMITQRACEYNCEKSPRPQNSAVHCTLLGEPIKSEVCIVPMLIYRKVGKDRKDRTNMTGQYGADPCVRETITVGFDANPICPFKQGTDYVVRVVLEDGSRRTMDNDVNNRISYSRTTRMWQYKYSTYSGNLLVSFVAGMCAIAGRIPDCRVRNTGRLLFISLTLSSLNRSREYGSNCPCSPLGPVDTGSRVANPVLINKLGACEKPEWSIWMLWDKNSGAVYKRPTKCAESRLACQAGEWFLYEGDRQYGILTLKASCV